MWTHRHLLGNPAVTIVKGGFKARNWLGVGEFGCVTRPSGPSGNAVSKRPWTEVLSSRHWPG